MRGRENEHGFTIMEMVIAVTMVAMMSVALWSVFRISVRSWDRGTDQIDSHQRHRSILDLVKKQIASTYGVIAPINLQTGGAIYPVFSGAPGSLQLVSLTSLRFQDNPGLTLVSYDVVQDKGGRYSLVEREQQYLGLDPESQNVFDRSQETVLTIFEDLESFTFEYYDPGLNQLPPRWVREWNAKEAGRLPSAISMTLVATEEGGRSYSRQLVIPIQAKPYDSRLGFVNPFESDVPRRILGESRR